MSDGQPYFDKYTATTLWLAEDQAASLEERDVRIQSLTEQRNRLLELVERTIEHSRQGFLMLPDNMVAEFIDVAASVSSAD
tara:strand:- start:359 stop:601 length:243 start_codon:yes stop_codon:yes gene_type:complete